MVVSIVSVKNEKHWQIWGATKRFPTTLNHGFPWFSTTDFMAHHPTLASQEWPGMRSQWERERCQVHLPQAHQGVIVPLTCKGTQKNASVGI